MKKDLNLSDEAERLCDMFGIMATTKGDANDDTVTLYTMIEELQDPEYYLCGPFCCYFLYHLTNPHESLGMQNDKKRDVNLISKLINGIFSHDREDKYDINTERLRNFVQKFNIKGEFE